jgi:acyl-CoA reductase-like NAD-dependent aldehyde dehydrogenase
MELDKDLQARQEARDLCKQAFAAQKLLRQMSQEQLDRIVHAIALAFADTATELAQLAVEETGFGNVKDKIEKNRFASQTVWQAVKEMKTVWIEPADCFFHRYAVLFVIRHGTIKIRQYPAGIFF